MGGRHRRNPKGILKRQSLFLLIPKKIKMENVNENSFSKKDLLLSVIAGLIIGLLLLPILKTAKPGLFEMIKVAVVPFFLIATPFGLFIAHVISKKLAFVWQLAKFVVIGGMNTLVDIGILALLISVFRSSFNIPANRIFLGLGIIAVTFYTLSKAISFIIANINSYIWNRSWTFNKQGEKTGKEFIQFFVISLVGFTINVIMASFVFGSVTPLAGLNSDQWGLIGAACGSVAGLAWNFLGYKFWVFKK
jgi:putative flippase GtrA